MKVWDIPIEDEWGIKILQGLKTVEGKKHSKTWRDMKIGDAIKFKLSFTEFMADVTNIHYYLHDNDQLTQFLIMEGINNCLPGKETLEDARNIYLKFYKLDEIQKYGMMAIFIKPQNIKIKPYYISIFDTNRNRVFSIKDKIPDEICSEDNYFKYVFPLPSKNKLRYYLCSYLFPNNSLIYYYEDFIGDKYGEINKKIIGYFTHRYEDDQDLPIFMENVNNSDDNDSSYFFVVVLDSEGEIISTDLLKDEY